MRLQVGLRNGGPADSSIQPVDDVKVDSVRLTQEQMKVQADIESRIRMIRMMRDLQTRAIVLRAQAGIRGFVDAMHMRANVENSMRAMQARAGAVGSIRTMLMQQMIALLNAQEKARLMEGLRGAAQQNIISGLDLRPKVLGFGLHMASD